MSKFDLEGRAMDLIQLDQTRAMARKYAIQLARELAEAIATEMESYSRVGAGGNTYTEGWNQGMYDCLKIARSFARPRTREDVYREALERIATENPYACGAVAKQALDEGAKVQP